MKYSQITNTDLRPSILCLGTHEFGSTVSEDDSFALMDRYLDAGGSFLDTADLYADWQIETPGASELTIGRWMKSRSARDKIVLATKGGSQTHVWPYPRLSRTELSENLELSLQRLQVESVDLFYLHVDDPDRSVEEILETLELFVQQGRIRYYAASNWLTARLRAAEEHAAKAGYNGFVASQIHWSLADAIGENSPEIPHVIMDEEIYRYHVDTGLPQCAYTSQASGFFSGRYSRNNPEAGKKYVYDTYNVDSNWDRLERAQSLACELGCSANQIALAYLIGQPFPVFPIIGCWRMPLLEDSLKAGDISLNPEQIMWLKNGTGSM